MNAKLKIRTATILDTVNLYRLISDFEKSTGLAQDRDEAARMAHVLHTITTGFVLVVERAGRILGSLGFGAGGPEFNIKKALVSQWVVLPHRLDENSALVRRLYEETSKFADKFKVEVVLGVSGEPSDVLSVVLQNEGFRPRSYVMTRSPNLDQPKSVIPADPEPADEGQWEPAAPTDPGFVPEDADPAGDVPDWLPSEPAVHPAQRVSSPPADVRGEPSEPTPGRVGD